MEAVAPAIASSTIYCGIDNGVSGSIGILTPDNVSFWCRTPVRKCRNYQKQEKYLNRVDTDKLTAIFRPRLHVPLQAGSRVLVLLERPYCNPNGFNASLLAARALEATLIVLESMELNYQFMDSKTWQNEMLPKGLVGTDELKKASLAAGLQLFPGLKLKKDADSLLMALWAQRHQL